MVNINKLRLTILQQRILGLLFQKTGIALNLRDIARNLDVSSPAVIKALPGLQECNLILKEQDKDSKRWSIELNRDNHLAVQLKRANNLSQIYESGLNDFLELHYAGASIILFGSYSRGDDTIRSDIDIAIIGREEKDVDLSSYEKHLGRQINLIFFENFRQTHKNLRENLCNGIVLSGGIEL